jgi:hypothetical protein
LMAIPSRAPTHPESGHRPFIEKAILASMR